jgi:truncated hemoglobin YjbI
VRTPFGRWFLAVCLLVPGLAGTLPAAENGPAAPDPRALDRHVQDVLYDVINEGADLYNGGSPSACCYLYQGALMTLPPLLEHRPDLKKAVRAGLADAVREPYAGRRAFALRAVIDRVYNAVYARPEEKTAAAPAPAAKAARGAETPRAGEKTVTPEPAKPEPATLWERLGGEDKVAKIADDFVNKVVKDRRVDFTRGGRYKMDDARLKDLKRKLVELASSVSGGPLPYTGKLMKDAHPQDMGITDAQFNAALDDMRQALQENGVKLGDMLLILAAVESTRAHIVAAGSKPVAKTLWERLGGKENVERIADDFLTLAVNDERVDFTRGGRYKIDDAKRKDLKQKLVGLASIVSGGPLPYTGKLMKEVHQGMGITEAQFDACLEDLKKALEKNGVKDEDVALIMAAAKTTQKNIVEGKMPGSPAPAPAAAPPLESRAPRRGEASWDNILGSIYAWMAGKPPPAK